MNHLKNLKILYVEDDYETREGLQHFLNRRAGKVCTAATAEEGLLVNQEFEPDILIVDLLLPDGNGLDMIREIKQKDASPHILITSTVSEIDTILNAVDLGIDHYIIKPINTEELSEKLDHMANRIAAERSKESATAPLEFVENKGLLEDEIRKEFLKILKARSGRGAKDVSVKMNGNFIEITALDPFTPIERFIFSNIKNFTIIEQFRRVFYKEIEDELLQMIQSIVKMKVELNKVNTNIKKEYDKVIFLRK